MAYIKGTCKKMITHREGLKPYRCDSLYDMNAKGYRQIPLDKLVYIKGLGKIWNFSAKAVK